MQDTLDSKIVKERSQILRELNIKLGLKYRRQFLGETAEVLIENDNGQISGRSERYFTVYLNKIGEKQKRNSIVEVKLIENGEHAMVGAIIPHKI